MSLSKRQTEKDIHSFDSEKKVKQTSQGESKLSRIVSFQRQIAQKVSDSSILELFPKDELQHWQESLKSSH
jgi:hypothetical protein